MYLKNIQKGIKRIKTQGIQRLLIWVFFLMVTGQSVEAQSSLADSIWQSLPFQDSVNKVEQFFLHIQKIQKQLKNSDITYAITIGLDKVHEGQNTNDIMACYELAGDLYDANPSMQLNALFLYNRAIEYAKKLKKVDQQIDVSLKMAWLYAKLHLPEKTYLIAKNAENWCKDPKTALRIPHISNYLRRIADCYVSAGKRQEGIVSFKIALKIGLFSDTLEKIYNYNNWGVNLMNLNRGEEAIRIFDKGIALAQRNKIEVWVGIMKGNQGWIYSNRGQLEHANTLVLYDLNASETFGDLENASRAAQLLAKIAIRQKNAPRAYHFLEYAQKLFAPIKYETSYVRLWSEYYALTNQWEQAYSFSKQAEALADFAIVDKNNKERHRLDNLIRFLEGETEGQRQLEQADFEKQQARDRSILVLLVFMVALGTGLIAYWRIKQREQALKIRLQESNAELNNYQAQLQEKNRKLEYFENIHDEARGVNYGQPPNSPYTILTQSTLLTEQDWRNFKSLFDQLYDGFIEGLSKHEAHFTPAEIRLLALLKLGLKNQEIATTLSITLDGVKKGRQRLKKKLQEWPQARNLIELLT